MIFLTHSTYQPTEKELSYAKTLLEKVLAREDLGFHQLPQRMHLWQTAKSRGQELRSKFQRMVILGIGGSSMGTKAIAESLTKKEDSHHLEFIDNIDSYFFWNKIKAFSDLDKTHFVLVSKSGNTVETLSTANFIDQYLKEKGLSLAKQATVISEPRENILTKWAKQNQVPMLEIPIDVGGRYSVLTPVGLLPAAFLGLDLEQMRQGALWGVQDRDLSAVLISQTIASFTREEWITCFWSYCDSLNSFGLWIQQLWSESLAKKLTRDNKQAPRVSTPIPLIGSRDQHSVLQQIAEGSRDKHIWFLRVSEAEDFGPNLQNDIFASHLGFEGKNLGRVLAALAQSTAQGLQQMGVHSLSLRLGQIREKELAALFMLFQVIVGALGEHLNINAFDQPGVELGKRLAKQILQN